MPRKCVKVVVTDICHSRWWAEPLFFFFFFLKHILLSTVFCVMVDSRLFQSQFIINTKQLNTDFSACTRSATNIRVNLKHLVRVFTLNLSLCVFLWQIVYISPPQVTTPCMRSHDPPFLESVYSALHHNNKYNFNFVVRASSGDLYSWYTWHMKTSL